MATSGPARIDVTVRRAGDEDAAVVADVLITSRLASSGAIPPAVHADDDVRRWVRSTLVPESEVWVAEVPDAGVVAVLALSDDWIDQLYVAPGHTGQGIGTRLVDLARRRRPEGLQLWTFASNVGAQRFYERHGFVAVETTDGSGNEEGAPDIRYVWPRRDSP